MSSRAKILDMLAAAAAAGQPCPTNKVIGAVLGRVAQVSDFYLRQLEAAGEISREWMPGNRRRICILATGQETAWTLRKDARA